jgi:sulfopyruvate decarboxylase TPP-binding subunit
MAKVISDDSAFAKHFIESAQILLAGEKFALAIQSLGNAIDAIKALKKKADGAA